MVVCKRKKTELLAAIFSSGNHSQTVTCGFYDSQINGLLKAEFEFMGWLTPALINSVCPTLSLLTTDKTYRFEHQLHGEERPFVMTGQYEKFSWIFIPVHLLKKSILIEDRYGALMKQLKKLVPEIGLTSKINHRTSQCNGPI
jgi:Na+-transporting NADH:ubiquinone oxidoreductase subunit NqrA